MPVIYVPAAQIDLAALTAAFNSAYNDYFIPMRLTQDQLQRSYAQTSVDYAASRVALDGEHIVGFGFLGVRDRRGWVGGVGVIPSHRGRGIARQVMADLLDNARGLGLETVQLEVIEDNIAARTLYESIGFRVQRRLLVIGCEDLPPAPEPSVAVRQSAAATVLRYYDSFHPVANPWQRQRESLQYVAQGIHAWTQDESGQLLAYTIGYEWDEVLNLLDVAFRPGREQAFSALMATLHHRFPNAICRLVNLGEDDPAWPLLQALGYEEKLAQYEMMIDVEKANS